MYTEDIPTVFPTCDRIIAIGDVHGDIERLLDMLYAAKIVDTNGVWIAEPKNTIVVQVGDQIDSLSRIGGEDWEKVPDYEVVYFMNRLDRQARLHGGRVVSILGNHEIMNTQGQFTYVSPKSMDPLRLERFRPGGSIARLMSKRGVIAKVGSVLFVHAAILPHHLEMLQGNIHAANVLVRKYLRDEYLSPNDLHVLDQCILGEHGMVWSRMYADPSIDESTMNDMIQNVLQATGCTTICTGHNTVQTISHLYNGKLWFLDTGISRSYGTTSFQVLEILNDGKEFKILELKK